jgi:peptidoglycan/LPS O-acetylase OafA/YrhL
MQPPRATPIDQAMGAAPDFTYIPALDGLRAASIALVVAAHFGLGAIVPGGLGVTVFFFVSGLLITRQLLAEHERTGRISLPRFYARRALRLYPALLVMVLLGGAAFALLGGSIRPAQLAAAIFYWSNYALLAGTFAGAAPHPYTVLWSLAVEEHFYLLFPLLLLLLWRRPRLALPAVAAVLPLVLIWRLVLLTTCADCAAIPDRIEYATDTRLDSILFGATLSLLLAGPLQSRAVRALTAWPALLVGIALLLWTVLERDVPFRLTWRYSLQGCALTCLIGWLLLAPHAAAIRRLASLGPLVWLGRLSYSLYLWHWMVLACAALIRPDRVRPIVSGPLPIDRATVATVAVLLPASLILAAGSYYLVERPMLRLRRVFGSRADQPKRVSPA